jgi:hypothetical protein
MRSTPTPATRRDGLIVRELDDETLVYDRERDEAHCLNRTAAFVWKHCDGQLSVPEIAVLMEKEFHTKVDPEIVSLALGRLHSKRLLTETIPRKDLGQGISRRAMTGRIAQAMVMALPIITTIVAPTPASAASCSPNCGTGPLAECCPEGCPCSGSAMCCSGQCSGGFCT